MTRATGAAFASCRCPTVTSSTCRPGRACGVSPGVAPAGVRAARRGTDRGTRGRTQPDARQVFVQRGAEGARDGRADRGGAEQAGDARDRVVDARGDPRLGGLRAGEHRRGQRRDGHREPEREHEQAGEHFGDVIELQAGVLEQQQAGGRDRSSAYISSQLCGIVIVVPPRPRPPGT